MAIKEHMDEFMEHLNSNDHKGQVIGCSSCALFKWQQEKKKGDDK